MSDVDQSLAHSKWDCKYNVVFVPKRRRKVIFGHIRRQLGPILRALAKQKECQIVEGHLMPDHVHMCIAIPPKHPVASVIGFLKGKSAIAIARLSGKERKLRDLGALTFPEMSTGPAALSAPDRRVHARDNVTIRKSKPPVLGLRARHTEARATPRVVTLETF